MSDTTRREFVAAASAGAAALAASAAAAQDASGPQKPKAPPTSARAAEYPAPPFPEQRQPWPGLELKMTPRPHDGERTYRGSGRLAGKRALITGGDSGIGRAVAIAFAREGADVAISHLPAEQPDADDVLRIIRAAGRRGVSLPGDIRQESVCRGLIEQTVAQLGGLDILVNNAARQQTRPDIFAISTDDFDATMRTNLYAMFWLTKYAVPHMAPGSVIIGTTSEQAADPSLDLIDYAITKAGIVNFTKSMAKGLAQKGIRVNAVAPGPVWTPLQVSGGATMEKLRKFGGDSPFGRPGQPAELAPVYVALADPMLSYSTGQIFAATGGNPQPS
jgi:NAD(P)-dependent dehydrogenase (short-subunit alcohol dehydrogenase family)